MLKSGARGVQLGFLLGVGTCVVAACSEPDDEPRDGPRDSGTVDNGVDAGADASVDASVPLMTMQFAQIVVGSQFACGITSSGDVRCWGDFAPSEAPSFTAAVQDLCAFEEHLCALTTAGSIECLNRPDWIPEPPTGTDFVALECMDVNTCARRSSGERVCWGTPDAAKFETSEDFVSYDGAVNYACGLRDDGSFACQGILSFDLGKPRAEPFKALASASDFNCGLTESGTIDCWGLDVNMMLDAPTGSGFTAIDASFRSACALRADRTPSCWGGSSFWHTTPSIPLMGLSVGRGFACGLTVAEGRGICWGIPSDGRLNLPLEMKQ
jgi:hypothetical protein